MPGWGLKEQLENSTVELLKASGRFSSVQRVTITSTRREEALKELKERYGERLMSRLCDRNTTTVIQLTGENLRTV